MSEHESEHESDNEYINDDDIFNQPISVDVDEQNKFLRDEITKLKNTMDYLSNQVTDLMIENRTLKNNINAYIEKRRQEIIAMQDKAK